MQMIAVSERPEHFIQSLVEVWEKSVRVTHLFLSDSEIENIKDYVPQALRGIESLVIAEDGNHIPVAFMGIEEGSLEMLFITPKERGKDLGKQLIQYGIEKFIKEHFFCAPEIFDRRKNQPDPPESIR